MLQNLKAVKRQPKRGGDDTLSLGIAGIEEGGENQDSEEGGGEDKTEIVMVNLSNASFADGWAYGYYVDSKEGTISLNTLGMTVFGSDKQPVDNTDYDVTVERTWYDTNKDKDQYEAIDPGNGIGIYAGDPEDEDDDGDRTKDSGFTEYRLTVSAAKDSNYSGSAEAHFYVMDKHSLNFVCSRVSFNNALWSGDWRMHERFKFGGAVTADPSVRTSADLTTDNYTVTYYWRESNEFGDDGLFVVNDQVENDNNDNRPKEPGRYIARITGENGYYGTKDVMVDIGSMFFNDDGNPELWSSSTKRYTIATNEEGEIQLKIGIASWGEDDIWGDDPRDVVLDNTERMYYAFDKDTNELILYGDNIFKKIGEDELELLAEIRGQDGTLKASAWTHVSIREAKIDYWPQDDRDMLTEWDHWFEKEARGRVTDSRHPDGDEFNYSITKVESDNQNVVKVEDNDDGFNIKAVGLGEATITVTHEPYGYEAGDPLENYTFKVFVKEDIYETEIWANAPSYIALPGEIIELEARVIHRSHKIDDETEDVTDKVSYAWSIMEENGGHLLADIRPDNTDAYKAVVTFKDYGYLKTNGLLDSNGDLWREVNAKAVVSVDGDIVASRSERLNVSNDYVDLRTYDGQGNETSIDSNMDVGGSTTATFKIIRYYISDNAGEYTAASSPVTDVDYDWEFDNKVVSIKHGNTDYDGTSIHDTNGDGVSFTIGRLKNGDSDFRIKYRWDDGEEDWRQFRFNELRYNIRFENDEINVFTDSPEDASAVLRMDDLGQNWDERFDVDIIAGKYEGDGDEDGQWTKVLKKGEDYDYHVDDVSGNVVFAFDEDFVRSIKNWDDFEVHARIVPNGADPDDYDVRMGEANAFFHFREARIDYDFEQDESKLPGTRESIGGVRGIWIENSEFPDGQKEKYYVRDVQVIEGEDLLDGEVEKKIKDDDNYWWDYRIKDRNDLPFDFDKDDEADDIVFEVTYEIPQGLRVDPEVTTASYQFTIHVVNDLYDVWMDIDGSKDDALWGESLSVSANGRHEYYKYYEEDKEWRYENDDKDLTYKWSYVIGSDLSQDIRDRLQNQDNFEDPFELEGAAINAPGSFTDEHGRFTFDIDDNNRGTVTFGEMWNNNDDDELYPIVEVYGSDPNTPEDSSWCRLLVHDDYTTVYPYELPDMEVGGKIRNQTFEVRRFAIGQAGQNDDGSETLDGVTLSFYEFNTDVIKIYDKSETYEENNNIYFKEIKPGDTSTGTRGFILERVGNGDSNLRVEAYWTEEDGKRHDNAQGYWFDRKDHNLRFQDRETSTVFTDGTLEYELDMGDFGEDWQDNYEVNFTVGQGYYDEDNDEYVWEKNILGLDKKFTPGIEYRVDNDKPSVTLIGSKLKDYIGERNLIVLAEVSPKSTGENDPVEYPEGLVCCSEDNWFEVSDVNIESDLPDDRDILRGDTFGIDKNISYFVQNSENPNWKEGQYTVTNVSLTDSDDSEFVEVERCSETDSEGEHIWWDVRGLKVTEGNKRVGIKVTYYDEEDETQTETDHEFTVAVKDDIYSVIIDSTSGEFMKFPGESIDLKATVRHEFSRGNGFDTECGCTYNDEDLTLEWTYEEDNEFDDLNVVKSLAEAEDDVGNDLHRVLTFKPLTAIGNDSEDFSDGAKVVVTVKDKEGNELCSNFDYYATATEYAQLYPLTVDPAMDVQDSVDLPMRVVIKHMNGSDEVVPEADFVWSFDEWCNEAYDNEGNQFYSNENVHVSADNNEKVTFRRNSKEYSRIVVRAEWGMGAQRWHAYYFEPKDYNIVLNGYDNMMPSVMEGESRTFSYTKTGFSNAFTFDAEAVVWDDDKDDFVPIEGMPDNSLSVTNKDDGIDVTVSEDAVDKLIEKGIKYFHIDIRASKNNTPVWSEVGREIKVKKDQGDWEPDLFAVASDGEVYENGKTLFVEPGADSKVFVAFITGGEENLTHDIAPLVGFYEPCDEDGNPILDEHEVPLGDLSKAGFTVKHGTAKDLGYSGTNEMIGDDTYGIEIDATGLDLGKSADLSYSLYEYDGDDFWRDYGSGAFSWDTNPIVLSKALTVNVARRIDFNNHDESQDGPLYFKKTKIYNMTVPQDAGELGSIEFHAGAIGDDGFDPFVHLTVDNSYSNKYGSYDTATKKLTLSGAGIYNDENFDKLAETAKGRNLHIRTWIKNNKGETVAFGHANCLVAGPCEVHQWGAESYEWNGSNSGVTAAHSCNVCGYEETETVDTKYVVTREATCKEKGIGTYTASFENEAFADQTKTVDIPIADHTFDVASYEWSESNTGVTATRKCRNCETVESEMVPATAAVEKATCDAAGHITFTSNAFTNAAFAVQTKTVDIAQLEHSYGEPTYLWAADNSSVTAKRICGRCQHEETETATIENNKIAVEEKAATTTEEGERTWTASFDNQAFAEQTKTEIISKVVDPDSGKENAEEKLQNADQEIEEAQRSSDGVLNEANELNANSTEKSINEALEKLEQALDNARAALAAAEAAYSAAKAYYDAMVAANNLQSASVGTLSAGSGLTAKAEAASLADAEQKLAAAKYNLAAATSTLAVSEKAEAKIKSVQADKAKANADEIAGSQTATEAQKAAAAAASAKAAAEAADSAKKAEQSALETKILAAAAATEENLSKLDASDPKKTAATELNTSSATESENAATAREEAVTKQLTAEDTAKVAEANSAAENAKNKAAAAEEAITDANTAVEAMRTAVDKAETASAKAASSASASDIAAAKSAISAANTKKAEAEKMIAAANKAVSDAENAVSEANSKIEAASNIDGLTDARNKVSQASSKNTDSNETLNNVKTSKSTADDANDKAQSDLKKAEKTKADRDEALRQGTKKGSVPKVKISKPVAAKKAVTVKWKKLTGKEKKNATNIEIWVCPNKKFSAAETKIVIVGKGKASKKVTNLKAKTKYFVKVRAIQKVGEVKYYKAWSSIKSVKTKK